MAGIWDLFSDLVGYGGGLAFLMLLTILILVGLIFARGNYFYNVAVNGLPDRSQRPGRKQGNGSGPATALAANASSKSSDSYSSGDFKDLNGESSPAAYGAAASSPPASSSPGHWCVWEVQVSDPNSDNTISNVQIYDTNNQSISSGMWNKGPDSWTWDGNTAVSQVVVTLSNSNHDQNVTVSVTRDGIGQQVYTSNNGQRSSTITLSKTTSNQTVNVAPPAY